MLLKFNNGGCMRKIFFYFVFLLLGASVWAQQTAVDNSNLGWPCVLNINGKTIQAGCFNSDRTAVVDDKHGRIYTVPWDQANARLESSTAILEVDNLNFSKSNGYYLGKPEFCYSVKFYRNPSYRPRSSYHSVHDNSIYLYQTYYGGHEVLIGSNSSCAADKVWTLRNDLWSQVDLTYHISCKKGSLIERAIKNDSEIDLLNLSSQNCYIACPAEQSFSAQSQSCECPSGTLFLPKTGACVPGYVDQDLNLPSLNSASPNSCLASQAYGDPILPAYGVQFEKIPLNISLGGQELILYYDSKGNLPLNIANPDVTGALTGQEVSLSSSKMSRNAPFGRSWKLNINGIASAIPVQGSASIVRFERNFSQSINFSNGNKLSSVANGAYDLNGFGDYIYKDFGDLVIEKYEYSKNLYKYLSSRNAIDGESVFIEYDNLNLSTNGCTQNCDISTDQLGLIKRISASSGRSVQFFYEFNRVAKIQDSNGFLTKFSYDDQGRLQVITWPDGTSKQFTYDSRFTAALTGVINESGQQYATFSYDAQGRAIQTSLAGGADRYSVSYSQSPALNLSDKLDSQGNLVRSFGISTPSNTQIMLPNGSTSIMEVVNINGSNYPSSKTQPAGSGCAASSSKLSYDDRANVTQKDDYNGNRSCYAYDASRNMVVSQVEGLNNSAICSTLTAANASLPAGSRKTSTQWHPDWFLKTKEASPGLIVTSVYNGQPDPTNGNAVANCMPTDTPKLPDGKVPVVLCKQVEQATLDANGSQGFSASLDSTVPARISQWSYDKNGKVIKATDPKGQITSYEYYTDTTFNGTDPNMVGHTIGDLKKVIPPKAALTEQYLSYDKAGRLLQKQDANGVLTTYTYTPRGQLKTETTADRTTTYEYYPTGLLQRVRLPGGQNIINYAYDAAQRLVGVSDQFDNKIIYTLDNAGKVTEEKVSDPSGVLQRQVKRSYDALNRVQNITGSN